MKDQSNCDPLLNALHYMVKYRVRVCVWSRALNENWLSCNHLKYLQSHICWKRWKIAVPMEKKNTHFQAVFKANKKIKYFQQKSNVGYICKRQFNFTFSALIGIFHTAGLCVRVVMGEQECACSPATGRSKNMSVFKRIHLKEKCL